MTEKRLVSRSDGYHSEECPEEEIPAPRNPAKRRYEDLTNLLANVELTEEKYKKIKEFLKNLD